MFSDWEMREFTTRVEIKSKKFEESHWGALKLNKFEHHEFLKINVFSLSIESARSCMRAGNER